MTQNSVELIRSRLQQAFAPTHLEVIDESDQHIGHAGHQGGGRHFAVVIPAACFKEMPRVAAHREIYALFADLIPDAIHALKTGGILKISFYWTSSPLEYEELAARVNTQFERMDDLEKEGVIKFLPVSEEFLDANEEWKKQENDFFDEPTIPRGFVHLQKTGSLEL